MLSEISQSQKNKYDSIYRSTTVKFIETERRKMIPKAGHRGKWRAVDNRYKVSYLQNENVVIYNNMNT